MELVVNNSFLGFRPQGNFSFNGYDSQDLFLENLKNKPDDWYYKDKEITYSFNNLGHRSKNIEDVDLDNYILFTGCSHTAGVGLELDKTYAQIVAKKLNCDYYNLAVSGSGLDIMMHNLSIWLHTIKKQPKYIILQWPDTSRFLSYEEGAFHSRGLWEKDPNILNFILAADTTNNSNAKLELAKLYVSTIPNVTTININYNNNDDILFEMYDLARDGLHFGIESNRILADLILEKISVNTKFV